MNNKSKNCTFECYYFIFWIGNTDVFMCKHQFYVVVGGGGANYYLKYYVKSESARKLGTIRSQISLVE